MLHLQIKFGCNWTCNFSRKLYQFYIFYLTWPQMTPDLGTWPLTSLTYKGTPTESLTQVRFQSDFDFSKETQITKTNIFHLTWPQIRGIKPCISLQLRCIMGFCVLQKASDCLKINHNAVTITQKYCQFKVLMVK